MKSIAPEAVLHPAPTTSSYDDATYIHARAVSGEPSPITFETECLSLSRPVWERLRASAAPVSEVARFRRVVNLAALDQAPLNQAPLDKAHGTEWLALTMPEIMPDFGADFGAGFGDGPFHLVLAELPPQPLTGTHTPRLEGGWLRIGPWRLRVDAARIWEPRPDWPALRPLPTQIAALRALAGAAACDCAVASPCVAWLRGAGVRRTPWPLLAALRAALIAGDAAALAAAVAALAGLGPGLTPSGDDFLAGVLLGMHATGCAASLMEQIYTSAAPHTTRFSRAWLRAAGDGLADARWHALLHALTQPNSTALQAAAQAVIAHGASSGLDMLAGWVWWMEDFALNSCTFESFS